MLSVTPVRPPWCPNYVLSCPDFPILQASPGSNSAAFIQTSLSYTNKPDEVNKISCIIIRAKVKEVKTKCHDVTAVVEVKEILKSSLVNIPKDTVNLYTNSGCLCPPLNANEEYIIMGYEDEERSRLLLVEGSIAEKWKDRLGKKVKRNSTLTEANAKSPFDF
ncbi:Secreted frizzled-related protein 3 [Chelonia mydas]|uniref:Secreted frizzled-related protein 3 n=1 Tax=Chelonia mydas TaxID=8469 RepID=M7AMB8_CHEMY|nr:Secreted frizzled-related protein 3 [Chelonia mydas]